MKPFVNTISYRKNNTKQEEDCRNYDSFGLNDRRIKDSDLTELKRPSSIEDPKIRSIKIEKQNMSAGTEIFE